MALAPLTPADIPEVMRIERLPGYEAYIGRWDADEHAAELGSPDARYFGVHEGAGLAGFVILQRFREPSVRLRRIAVDGVERGLGTRILRVVMDWVFERSDATALHLDVHVDNARAQHVYTREGFVDQGRFDAQHRLMEISRSAWSARRSG
ncbi:GNAT family N-acetyltransferase [Phenylobacterium sp.]|uniref:GNAT family N-acetyltransferase n=1 Tax=Phenylobacterium sp. TaxID=1871053 RepID=UPI003D2E14CC